MKVPLAPTDCRSSIAVDLGAESCRVSLLRWRGDQPEITLVHRFPNAARELDGHLRWDLSLIEAGLDDGLRRCAAIATEGVRSIAVDGWAVDYVHLGNDGRPLADPFCYRDQRTVEAERSLHARCSPERLHQITGVQLLRINTVYQLHSDTLLGLPQGAGWLNLPEYILFRWGARCVAEYTNATHTQMVDLARLDWSPEIFAAARLDLDAAPTIVAPGTIVGRLRGQLATLPAFADTVLIAPACHDTASAIAGIPAIGDDWAYISSGTWSLVGALLEQPSNDPAAAAENFTNLGAVGDRICFHKNVNGMWLIRQCIEAWKLEGHTWTVPDLVAAAEHLDTPTGLLDVDAEDLLLAGSMPQRINAQRRSQGLPELDESALNAPAFASLIFHSLASTYAAILRRVEHHTGKHLKRLFIVGGASQNQFLNRLTRQATGLQVFQGSAESSTIGNFAVQLAALEMQPPHPRGPRTEQVSAWSALFGAALTSPSTHAVER